MGLLTGGVLTGQSLIRAAELRSITEEYSRYVTATQTFRGKYLALPGDMSNATRFWSRLNANADCVTNSAAAVATPGTCDGDGDGFIESASAASQSGEIFQFWKQLANAGLVEGSYTGIAGSSGVSHAVSGTNAPAGKISTSGWTPSYVGFMPISSILWFEGEYGTVIRYGGQSTTGFSASLLKPEEMWNIDTKMDDGKPGTGMLRTGEGYSFCQDQAASNSVALASVAVYSLASSTVGCALVFNLIP